VEMRTPTAGAAPVASLRGRPTILVLGMLVVAAAGLLAPCRAVAKDPWYEDVSSRFWAYRDIRVMWEEECTDGWAFTRWRWTPWGNWEETVARFYPNDPITRAQYAMVMAKTLRLHPQDDRQPTFTDVPRDLTLYGDKPGYGYIEALAAQGWIVGSGDGRFRPHDFIERQHAVAVLVRALGLSSFAQLIAPEAGRCLDRFPDGYQVDPMLAPQMALAIRLGIIIGHDDGCLRPRDNLWRCQAVAILARSALIDATANPPRLSPDGDGVEDTTSFTFRTLKNRSTRSWSLAIGNVEGEWYRSFYPEGHPGEPPPSLVWDGRDDRERSLPDGIYFYRAWITDCRGERFRSALKPLTLERRRLWGNLYPSEVNPGQNLTVQASTTGGAQRVVAHSDGVTFELTPSSPPLPTGSNTWSAALTAPGHAEEGTRQVRLVASFPGTTRTLNIYYYLRDSITLTGTLDPNPARAGGPIRIAAFTSTNASSVKAELPWGERLTLQPSQPGRWQGSFRTRPDTPEGTYTVMLEAQAGTRSKRHPLQLVIEGSTLQDLAIILSD